MGLAFAEEGNTEGRETLVGWINASNCLWPAGDIWAAGGKRAVELLHHICEVRAGVMRRGQQVLRCCLVGLWAWVGVKRVAQ